MNDLSDEVLAALVASSGDRSAFEQLVRRHHSRVRNWLRHITGNAALADDVAQETFIQAWRRIGSFDGRGRFSSWLMAIAYRIHVKEYERERRRAAGHRQEMAITHSDSDRQIGETHAEIQRVLCVLSSEERATIILSHAYGYSHSEISEITGMPVGTIKSHIRRGKAKFNFCPEREELQ